MEIASSPPSPPRCPAEFWGERTSCILCQLGSLIIYAHLLTLPGAWLGAGFRMLGGFMGSGPGVFESVGNRGVNIIWKGINR